MGAPARLFGACVARLEVAAAAGALARFGGPGVVRVLAKPRSLD